MWGTKRDTDNKYTHVVSAPFLKQFSSVTPYRHRTDVRRVQHGVIHLTSLYSTM